MSVLWSLSLTWFLGGIKLLVIWSVACCCICSLKAQRFNDLFWLFSTISSAKLMTCLHWEMSTVPGVLHVQMLACKHTKMISIIIIILYVQNISMSACGCLYWTIHQYIKFYIVLFNVNSQWMKILMCWWLMKVHTVHTFTHYCQC